VISLGHKYPPSPPTTLAVSEMPSCKFSPDGREYPVNWWRGEGIPCVSAHSIYMSFQGKERIFLGTDVSVCQKQLMLTYCAFFQMFCLHLCDVTLVLPAFRELYTYFEQTVTEKGRDKDHRIGRNVARENCRPLYVLYRILVSYSIVQRCINL
jgi:hypothetical protein